MPTKSSALIILKFLPIIMLLLLSQTVTAKESAAYSLETDPSTMLLDGYALHFRVSPARFDHWSFGIGAYAMDIPAIMVNINSANRNRGWQLRLQSGIGIFSEYFFEKSQRGWYLGAQLAKQVFTLDNAQNDTAATQFTNGLMMLQWGYRWHPQPSSPWYVQPWLGLGYTQTLSGTTAHGSLDYNVDPLIGFATLHIGYAIQ